MSSRDRALSQALRSALIEEARAAALYTTLATTVRHAQLHGKFQQFGSQEEGALATVEALAASRGVDRPVMAAAASFGGSMQGRAARVKSWRTVVEGALDNAEHRAHVMHEAASGARLAGDADVARNLETLRENAGAQAKWLREFLK